MSLIRQKGVVRRGFFSKGTRPQPASERGGVACAPEVGETGRGFPLFGRWGRGPARRASTLGLRAPESGVTAAWAVAGNAV